MTQDNPREIKPFEAPQSTQSEVIIGEPDSNRRLVSRKIEKIEQHFSGPLPPPEILASYEQIVPGSAEQIINVAIKQSDHRMNLETTVVEGDSNRAYLGVIFAFIISLAVLGVSYVLVTAGQVVAGTILGVIDLATLAGVFIYGTNSRKKERTKKNKAIKEKTQP
jgi:uncharacterized membrane protein